MELQIVIESNEVKRCPRCGGYKSNKLEWLTSEEAAAYLRKTVPALRVLVHRGHVKARKFARRLYFRRVELDELLETSFMKEEIHGNQSY